MAKSKEKPTIITNGALELWKVSLRDYFETMLNEHDRYIEARFNALISSIQSLEKSFNASHEASDRAIIKAEQAQNAYNESHNDIIRRTMSRVEVEGALSSVNGKLDVLKNDVASLRESRSEGGGREKSTASILGWAFGAAGIIIAIISLGMRALGR